MMIPVFVAVCFLFVTINGNDVGNMINARSNDDPTSNNEDVAVDSAGVDVASVPQPSPILIEPVAPGEDTLIIPDQSAPIGQDNGVSENGGNIDTGKSNNEDVADETDGVDVPSVPELSPIPIEPVAPGEDTLIIPDESAPISQDNEVSENGVNIDTGEPNNEDVADESDGVDVPSVPQPSPILIEPVAPAEDTLIIPDQSAPISQDNGVSGNGDNIDTGDRSEVETEINVQQEEETIEVESCSEEDNVTENKAVIVDESEVLLQ